MALPLVPLLMGAGLAVGAGANLYSQRNQRMLYRRYADAYNQMYKGYDQYLTRQGRAANPARKMLSYYGQYQSQETNIKNSYAGSVGTAGGTFGAGVALSKRWL